MPGRTKTIKPAPATAASKKLETVHQLRTILSLVHTARANAAGLKARDEVCKSELLDSFSIAELSVLRMLDDEAYGGS